MKMIPTRPLVVGRIGTSLVQVHTVAVAVFGIRATDKNRAATVVDTSGRAQNTLEVTGDLAPLLVIKGMEAEVMGASSLLSNTAWMNLPPPGTAEHHPDATTKKKPLPIASTIVVRPLNSHVATPRRCPVALAATKTLMDRRAPGDANSRAVESFLAVVAVASSREEAEADGVVRRNRRSLEDLARGMMSTASTGARTMEGIWRGTEDKVGVMVVDRLLIALGPAPEPSCWSYLA